MALVITGAAGDIGQAIAARLWRDHAGVVMVDIDPAGVEAAAARIPGAVPVTCDVTDPEALLRLAAEVGPVRTLVNNAGAARGASLAQMTVADWQADRALNLDAAWNAFRAFAPALIEAKGSVVNIASVNGLSTFGHPAYSAAKAGMIHLTRMIAVEYGRHGLRANAVAPGTVATRAWEARRAANPHVFEEAAEHYPLRRVVTPEDVAEAVAFLASPAAAAITGTCLPVDCGLTAGIPALARTFSQTDDY